MSSYHESLPIFSRGHGGGRAHRYRRSAFSTAAQSTRSAPSCAPLGTRGRSGGLFFRVYAGDGQPVAVALDQSEWCGNVKRRHLAYLFEPMGAETREEEL